jgi:hypothetical protein
MAVMAMLTGLLTDSSAQDARQKQKTEGNASASTASTPAVRERVKKTRGAAVINKKGDKRKQIPVIKKIARKTEQAKRRGDTCRYYGLELQLEAVGSGGVVLVLVSCNVFKV